MRFASVDMGVDSGFMTISFKFPFEDREEVRETINTVEKFMPLEEYELMFTKQKKSRSLNANSYMWVLCDKIAKIIRTTKEEVYRRAIREVGVFSDVAVQERAVAELVSAWGGNGIGYFSEMFDSRLTDKDGNPMKRVRLYKGSHGYSSQELSPVIDYIVEEARGLNIEVLSDNKIKELKASWNG